MLHYQALSCLRRCNPITVFLEDLKVISHIDAWIDQEGVLHFK
ncbi:hypothetical protein [Chitinophaga polysaccharea]|nr:hypothetical protein [Chitinophaga polysaccharea]